VVKLFVAALGLASILVADSADFDRARKLYDQTDFEQSIKVLGAIPAKDGPVYALMGRNYYMQGDYKKATEALEKAFSADPRNADYALWLGRSYGRRAETSSPFTAPGQASKARQYFEKSVQLNPHNLDALSDLLEYYLEAPGFLGGGMDKAQTAAAQIAKISPPDGDMAYARIAERSKQYSTAEEHLRRAIDAGPQKVGRIIELAHFLAKQGRVQEADQSLALADKIAPGSPRVMYAKADLYIRGGRNLDLARDLLKRYITCNLTPEDPPRSDAEKLLRRTRANGL
jgi:tetratricopeptide (TPR) repeat protein